MWDKKTNLFHLTKINIFSWVSISGVYYPTSVRQFFLLDVLQRLVKTFRVHSSWMWRHKRKSRSGPNPNSFQASKADRGSLTWSTSFCLYKKTKNRWQESFDFTFRKTIWSFKWFSVNCFSSNIQCWPLFCKN